MRALLTFVEALTIPLAFLNIFGGIVAGIWLMILGEWSVLISGVVAFLLSNWILAFALLPSLGLTVAAISGLEKGRKLQFVVSAFLSNLYVVILMVVWCVGVLYYYVSNATPSSLVPIVIWSYGIATGPWSYMASKEGQPGEGGGFGSTLLVLLSEIAYVVVGFIVLFGSVLLIDVIWIFSGFMVIALIIQTVVVLTIQAAATADDGDSYAY